MSLINSFIEKKLISEKDIFGIELRIEKDEILDEILESYKISAEDILKIKKEYYKIDLVEIDRTKPLDSSVLDLIPIESVKRYQVVPLYISEDDALVVGMLDPENSRTKSVLQFISSKIGKPYVIKLISLSDFNHIKNNYSGLGATVSQALGEYSDVQEEELRKLQEKTGDETISTNIIQEDAPISKIVSNIIKYAAEHKASDVHIEVDDKEISVRYRIDGVLKKNLTLPKNIQFAVAARIKILSKIKIDEKRKPQDGRFSGNFLGRRIDFRVSTFPTYFGEKIVMRLLEQERGALSLKKLGFNQDNLNKIKKIIKMPYGIVLVCGPTGSGKTNTLYSLLNEVDKERKNVISLENPIELNIPGVSQSQIRPEIGYTFANGLRTVLRQDPDIIMIGEIRDTETAKLAIRAALTGHLVLATIHTNTAADVPQRLVDMGVEPYLIGPTLVASIGQRLIRTIAPESKEQAEMPNIIREFIDKQIKDLSEDQKKIFVGNKIYQAKKTKLYPMGMSGRIAVFEILQTTTEIQRKMLTDPSSISIYNLARKNNNFITFKEDAILKALEGITTFDEVIKL